MRSSSVGSLRSRLHLGCVAMVCAMAWGTSARANLLVYPTGVFLDRANTSGKVTVRNISSVANTYRIQFTYSRVKPDGTMDTTPVPADQLKPEDRFLGNDVRVSPREVTLNPGEQQVVKFALKPNSLPPGEYRANVEFYPVDPVALPEKKAPLHNAKGGTVGDNVVSTTVKSRIVIGIPILYANGEVKHAAAVENIRRETTPGANGEKKPIVKFDLVNQGEGFLRVDVTASAVAPGLPERVVGILNGAACYGKKREVVLDLNDEAIKGVDLNKAKVRIDVFEAARDGVPGKLLGKFPNS